MNAPTFTLEDIAGAFGTNRGVPNPSPLDVAVDALESAGADLQIVTEAMHAAGQHDTDGTAHLYAALVSLWGRLGAAVTILDRCRVEGRKAAQEPTESEADHG
jgi:hypothetical protein